ncbi:MAG: hypothetical protein ABI389_08820 [Rhodanobacter sp.]
MGAVAGVALLQASTVYAYKMEVIVKAQNKSDFSAVMAAVHQQMQPGGRYEFVNHADREKVDASFADMQSLFDKYGTVAQMDQPVKVQLFNDQEVVNAVLTHNDDKRLICESVSPIGSHIPRTTCRTYREVEQEHHNAQNFQQQLQQVNQASGRSLPVAGGGH